MVYPQRNDGEIGRIVMLNSVYRDHGLAVPAIREVIDGQAVILEDAGDCLVQRWFRSATRPEKLRLLHQVGVMLGQIASIPLWRTDARLDSERMKREMDFFVDHFLCHALLQGTAIDPLREILHLLVDRIDPSPVFAHRDFHSRNMLRRRDRIYLVDFQDSLAGPPGYDLVSFAFDSYLELGPLRPVLLAEADREGVTVDRRQFLLVALQRNIKALGTFGFQVRVRRNLVYRRYIPRTLRHVSVNLRQLDDRELRPLADYFAMASNIELG